MRPRLVSKGLTDDDLLQFWLACEKSKLTILRFDLCSAQRYSLSMNDHSLDGNQLTSVDKLVLPATLQLLE